MTRSRYSARYDIAEDRDILKWYHAGKGIYSIANELNRTPNAIKRRIDEILIPLQNAAPIYSTPKSQEQPTLSIIPDVASDEQEYIQTTFQRFNTIQEAVDYLLKNPFIASPRTPPKSIGMFGSLFGFLIPK